MRVGLIGLCLGAAAALALAAPGVGRAAVDNEQFCKAMGELARLGAADVGRWLDRNTRDDGIDVICDIRTVNYKRFVKIGPGPQDPGWKARKEQEWNSIACNSIVLRDAILGGWYITSTFTTAAGQRVIVLATCPK